MNILIFLRKKEILFFNLLFFGPFKKSKNDLSFLLKETKSKEYTTILFNENGIHLVEKCLVNPGKIFIKYACTSTFVRLRATHKKF